MISLLLLLVQAQQVPKPDSVYATPALRSLVAASAVAGRRVPASLQSYRALVESEVAIIIRSAAPREGAAAGGSGTRERAMQLEQVESALNWSVDGGVEQHVIGHRSRAVTANVSALSYFRRPWVVPLLYGNRLHLLLGRGSARDPADTDSTASLAGSAPRARGTGDASAVHPLADDRDAFYRFTGGDTIAVLRIVGRAIPIVRVFVEPRADAGRALLFRGVLDIDASRMQIVRLRGQFVTAHHRASLLRRVLSVGWETVVFAELVNGEFDGRYWLPTTQRLEGQARSALASGFRPIVRVASKFSDYTINDPQALTIGTATDSTCTPDCASHRAQLTFAPRDSMSAFHAWRAELGDATGRAQASDFDDVATDNWRPQGRPRLDWRAERLSDVLRFNRVEGLFTGTAVSLRFRDAAPGLSVGAYGGWSWAGETPRGALWSQWDRGRWQLGTRVERALANTNDFRPQLDFEQSLMAFLITADDYDYVDRWSATATVSTALPVRGAPVLRFEAGPARDRAELAELRFGLIHLDSNCRGNRAVTPGSYFRSAVGIVVHPNVSGEFLEPGLGGAIWYERGDGNLQWQRLEARVTARRTIGAFSYAGRTDAIAVFSRNPVPQQLVEFGENEGLPGYAFKEFGGDRAVLSRAAVSYELPLLRAPLRVHIGRRFFLPGLSPSLAMGVQAGWAAASNETARRGLALFGTRTDTTTGRFIPATRPTDGIRSTVSFTVRVFGGALGVGVARPIDQHARSSGWRFVFGVGQAF